MIMVLGHGLMIWILGEITII